MEEERESSGGGAEEFILTCGQMVFGEFMCSMHTTFTFSPGGLPFVTVQAVFLQGAL